MQLLNLPLIISYLLLPINSQKNRIFAKLLQTDEKELLSLWLADQVTAVVAGEKEIAEKVLDIAKQKLKK